VSGVRGAVGAVAASETSAGGVSSGGVANTRVGSVGGVGRVRASGVVVLVLVENVVDLSLNLVHSPGHVEG